MKQRILLVDDDANMLAYYRELLGSEFDADTAQSGAEALELMSKRGPYAVLVADLRMPEMDGVELLIRAQSICPETVRIVLSGNIDQRSALDAINQGHVFLFVTKPFNPEVLLSSIQSALKQYELVIAERELLERTLSGSINMLTEVLSLVEPESFGHGQKVREYLRVLARHLGLTQIWELEMAALLCRIGYVTLPARLVERLRTGVALSTLERQLVMRVPEFGKKLLANIPRLEPVAEIIYLQEKNFDGTGFPDESIDGDKIPFGARVVKVLSDLVRHEAEGMTRGNALEVMGGYEGQYDPRVLEVAVECLAHDTPKNGRPIALCQLTVGQVLAASVETMEGLMIIPEGSRVSPILLEKLKNFSQVSPIREPIYIQTD